MPTPQRLPIVNSDDGVWGNILVQWLKKEHYDDGTDNAVNGGHQMVTLRAGTASAGTAPLKFSSGSLLTTAEAGALEFLTDGLYFTVTTGAIRRTIATYDDSSGAIGDVYYRNSSGSFTRLGVGSSGNVLTVTSGLPAWSPPVTGGDASTNTSTSVDSEVALFSGTAGKTLKRATGTGFAKLASGVLSAAAIAESDVTNLTSDLAAKAPLASPAFTGSVTSSGGGLSLTDGTSTDGEASLGVSNIFGSGWAYLGAYGISTDSWPTVAIWTFGAAPSLVFGPGGSTFPDISLSRTGSLALSLNSVLTFADATAADGSVAVGVTGFASFVTLKGNSGDANPMLALAIPHAGQPTITMGPGGGSTTDISISRTGTATATVTGTFTFSSAPVISSLINTGTLTLPTSTDTLVGRATTDTLTNKTLTTPIISSISNTGTLTLPTSTDTLVGRVTTDTLTNKTLTSPIISSISNTGTLTLPTSTDTLVGRATTDTFTNKRITPRVTTVTSSATPTLNTDSSDALTITALAAAITSMTSSLTGTPNNFDKLTVRIKDNGTARAIIWGAKFEPVGVPLPTTTVISKRLTVGFIYDTVTAKWGCVASAQEA